MNKKGKPAAKPSKAAPKPAAKPKAGKAKAAKAAAAKPKPAKAAKAPAVKPKPAKAAAPTEKKPTAPAATKAAKSPSKAEPSLPQPSPKASGPSLAAKQSAFSNPEAPSLKAPEPDDQAGLKNVMDAMSSIFGGRDFLSDAELDAFLDSKMASGEIPPSLALDPLDEAQSLIYEAWNSEGPQRVRLARMALETSADCADAYVILAEEEAKDRKQAVDLYRKGLEAGERAVKPEVFKQSVGRFWEVMETRPYMRARLGLAESLWELGKKDEALVHLRELMLLNPADNQGVRYILAQCLLETGEEGELGDLLARFRKDTSPQIRYSHALWAFRHDGPNAKTASLLAEALKSNPHVPAYLLKKSKLPKTAPKAADVGSDEEAAAYAMGAVETWHGTLGAVEWLAGNT